MESPDNLYKCDFCQKEYKLLESLKRHIHKHINHTPYHCDKCDKKYSRADYLKSHVIYSHSEHKPFSCVVCGMGFSVNTGLTNHMAKVHMNNGSSDKLVKCSNCNKRFRHKSSVTETSHGKLIKSETFSCPKTELDEHVSEEFGNKLILCQECSIRRSETKTGQIPVKQVTVDTYHSNSLNDGNKSKSDVNEIQNPSLLSNIFGEQSDDTAELMEERKELLKDMIERTDNKNNYVPELVQKSAQLSGITAEKPKIKEERVLESPGDTYKLPEIEIEIVNDAIAEKVSVNGHFLCSVCSQTFSNRSVFRRHRYEHMTQKPFKCQQCSYSCIRKDYFHTHMTKHTGKKLFQCALCSKSFATKSYLKMHLERHTNERNYHCRLCNKNFKTSDDLSKHKRLRCPVMIRYREQGTSELLKQENLPGRIKNIEQFPELYNIEEQLQSHKKLQSSTEQNKNILDLNVNETESQTLLSDTEVEMTYKTKDFTGKTIVKPEIIVKMSEEMSMDDHKSIVAINGTTESKEDAVELSPKKVDSSEMKSKSYGKYYCSICKERYTKKEHLQKHKYNVHSIPKPFICSHCDYACFRKEHIDAHMTKHTGKKMFDCTKCDKSFATIWYLKIHVKRHTNERNYQCQLCKKHYKTSDDLSKHKRLSCPLLVHYKEKGTSELLKQKKLPIKNVENLPELYNIEEPLQSHKKLQSSTEQNKNILDLNVNETDGQTLLSDLTGKTIDIPEVLMKMCEEISMDDHESIVEINGTTESQEDAVELSHEKVDSGEREKKSYGKFFCSICKERYTKEDHLQKHRYYVHSIPKPFICSHCDYACFRKEHLAAHMTKHTGQKLFKCTQCDKCFARKIVLIGHMKTHSNARNYQCSLCKMCYKSAKDCKRHVRLSCKAWKHSRVNNTSNILSSKNKTPDKLKTYSTSFNNKEHFKSYSTQHSDFNKVLNDENDHELNFYQSENQLFMSNMTAHLKEEVKSMVDVLDSPLDFTRTTINSPENTFKSQDSTVILPENTEMSKQTTVKLSETDELLNDTAKRKRKLCGNYHCSICKEGYTKKEHLQKHKYNVHSTPKPFICSHCDYACFRKEHLVVHMTNHTVHKIFNCTQCGKSFAKKRSLIIHIETHSNVRKYQCRLCKKCYKTAKACKTHVRFHCKAWKLRRINATSKLSLPEYQAAMELKQKFSEKESQLFLSNTTAHLKAEIKGIVEVLEKPVELTRIATNSPEKTFKSPDPIVQLSKTRSKLPEPTTESKQSSVILSETTADLLFNNNEKKRKSFEKYCCSICQKSYTLKENLQKHRHYMHSISKPFICGFCDYSCFRKEHLEVHLTKHTGQSKLNCTECGKYFAAKYLLKKHAETHSKARKYRCRLCQMCFKTASTCRKHVRLHCKAWKQSRIKVSSKTQTDLSNTTANMKEELKNMVEVLDNQVNLKSVTYNSSENTFKSQNTKYTCTVCGKSSSNKYYLKYHMQRHSNKRNYQCQSCKKRFKTFSDIKRHTQLHCKLRKHKNLNKVGELTIHSPEKMSKSHNPTNELPETEDKSKQTTVNLSNTSVDLAGTNSDLPGTNSKVRKNKNDKDPSKPVESLAVTEEEEGTDAELYEGTIQSKIIEEKIPNETIKYDENINGNYCCKICNEMLSSNGNLKRHMYTHSNQRRFKCTLCDYTCIRKYHLDTHISKHKQNVAFECTKCEKTFPTKHYLECHIATHFKNIPTDYQCQACKKYYRNQATLQKHKLLHYKTMKHKEPKNITEHPISEDKITMKNIKCSKSPSTEENCHSHFTRHSKNNMATDNATVKELNVPVNEIESHTLWPYRLIQTTVQQVEKNKKKTESINKKSQQKLDLPKTSIEIPEISFELPEPVVELREPSIELQESTVEVQESTVELEETNLEVPETKTELSGSTVESIETTVELKGTQVASPELSEIEIEVKVMEDIVKSKKKVKRSYNCSVCKKNFAQKCSFTLHMYRHSGERPFKCTVCDYSCLRKAYLDTHMAKHTGSKDYKCTICSKSFAAIYNLKQHILTHSNKRNYQCQSCKKYYKNSSALRKHEKLYCQVLKHNKESDTNDSDFTAPVVDNSNAIEKMLKQLKRRPSCYNCSVCNKSFRNKTNYTLHMYKHSGERPFKCTVCDYSCLRKPHLDAHMAKHTGNKDYKCTICSKSFAAIFQFKQHILTHSTKRNYQCQSCKSYYKTATHLSRHKKLKCNQESETIVSDFTAPVNKKTTLSKDKKASDTQEEIGTPKSQMENIKGANDNAVSEVFNPVNQITTRSTKRKSVAPKESLRTPKRPVAQKAEANETKISKVSQYDNQTITHSKDRKSSNTISQSKNPMTIVKVSNDTDLEVANDTEIHNPGNQITTRPKDEKSKKTFHLDVPVVYGKAINQDKNGKTAETEIVEQVQKSSFSEIQIDKVKDVQRHHNCVEIPIEVFVEENGSSQKTTESMPMKQYLALTNENVEDFAKTVNCAEIPVENAEDLTKSNGCLGMIIEKSDDNNDEHNLYNVDGQACELESNTNVSDFAPVVENSNAIGDIPKKKEQRTVCYNCSVCNTSFRYKSNYTRHMYRHNGERPFKCTVCDYSCLRKAHLDAHMTKHTGNKDYKCTICSKSFAAINYLKIHTATHSNKRNYQCQSCKKYYKTSSDLKRHEKMFCKVLKLSKESDNNEVSDLTVSVNQITTRSKDNNTSDTKEALGTPKSPMTNIKVANDNIVSEVFNPVNQITTRSKDRKCVTSKKNLRTPKSSVALKAEANETKTSKVSQPDNQTSTHSKDRKSSNTISQSKNPMTIVKVSNDTDLEVANDTEIHNPGNLITTCSKDRKSADSKTTIQSLSLANNENRVNNNVINKLSKYLNEKLQSCKSPMTNLKVDESFRCLICDQSFTQKGNLKRHMLRHTGEKQFKCQFCDSSFIRKNELIAHTSKHTGSKPFTCTECDKTFPTSNYLQFHMKIHNNQRNYQCLACKKCYKTSQDCKKHVRFHCKQVSASQKKRESLSSLMLDISFTKKSELNNSETAAYTDSNMVKDEITENNSFYTEKICEETDRQYPDNSNDLEDSTNVNTASVVNGNYSSDRTKEHSSDLEKKKGSQDKNETSLDFKRSDCTEIANENVSDMSKKTISLDVPVAYMKDLNQSKNGKTAQTKIVDQVHESNCSEIQTDKVEIPIEGFVEENGSSQITKENTSTKQHCLEITNENVEDVAKKSVNNIDDLIKVSGNCVTTVDNKEGLIHDTKCMETFSETVEDLTKIINCAEIPVENAGYLTNESGCLGMIIEDSDDNGDAGDNLYEVDGDIYDVDGQTFELENDINCLKEIEDVKVEPIEVESKYNILADDVSEMNKIVTSEAFDDDGSQMIEIKSEINNWLTNEIEKDQIHSNEDVIQETFCKDNIINNGIDQICDIESQVNEITSINNEVENETTGAIKNIKGQLYTVEGQMYEIEGHMYAEIEGQIYEVENQLPSLIKQEDEDVSDESVVAEPTYTYVL